MEGAEHNQQGREQQDLGHQLLEPHPEPRGVIFEFGYLSPTPPNGESWDEWVIERGIEAALREGRSIDDRAAHYIAAQLHEGQASALYSLASTGKIDESGVNAELAHDAHHQTDQVRRWVRWLSGYCALRLDTGPVDNWNQRVAEQDRADLAAVQRERIVGDLDVLFGEQADEEIGSVHELGLFGLVRHEGKPGGLILGQDEQGFRRIWATHSEPELDDRWRRVLADYERFYRELDQVELDEDDTGAEAGAATPTRSSVNGGLNEWRS